MVVGGYRFTVQDASGRSLRTIEEITVPPGPGERFTFKTLTGVCIPDRLIWEGRADDGSFAPDGEYTHGVQAWDAAGNMGKSPRFVVVVDNTPPRVTVTLPYDTFSPNGDGNREVLAIKQRDASTEDEWTGEITGVSGGVVRSFRWPGVPSDLAWDGTDEAGATVPDGTYRYKISSTDRAGNHAVRRQLRRDSSHSLREG